VGDYDVIVVGGGFFGCRIALECASHGQAVLILELSPELMTRASYANQARVHGGYHYPRSILTALRSRANLPEFSSEYADCIDTQFDQYYAVSRQLSKVTEQQFRLFCERINAPISVAPPSIKRLFNDDLVAEVYRVQEYAFDAAKLRARLARQLADRGVAVRTGAEALKVERTSIGLLVRYLQDGATDHASAKQVINCTYARINHLNRASGLPEIPLKHELAEIALVQPPEELRHAGVTMMCGPFFSIMPFPPRGLHSFTHVRYTPHTEWHEPGPNPCDPYRYLKELTLQSAYAKMLADAKRYMPCLEQTKRVDSLYEVKTVLPRSEGDDSRPILLRRDHGLEGYSCIMGAKIDNIYDVQKEFLANASAPA
jgi:glycine/D-amino acid oxidase-like deaminating enzyme